MKGNITQMEPKTQPLQSGVVVAILPTTEGMPGVSLILGQKNTFTTAEGSVLPGIALTPAKAREIAYHMLLFAQMIENGTAAQAAPAMLSVQ